MWAQRMIRFLGRMVFYMLLIPSLICLIYTLVNQQLTASMIFLTTSIFIFYFGLIRIRVPANSVAVRNGKVVYCMPDKTVRNRFDFYSRGQTIIELPHFSLLDCPYKLEIFSPDNGEGVTASRLMITLEYLKDMDGYQRAYDSYIRYQEKLSLVVKKELCMSASRMVLPVGAPGETGREGFLKLVREELGGTLASRGLGIKEVDCVFYAGPTVVRLVASEQEMIEMEIIPVTT